MAFTYVNQNVYSGINPDDWEDLELAPHIGEAKRVLAYFKVLRTSPFYGFKGRYSFRPNGETGNWEISGSTVQAGINNLQENYPDKYNLIACWSDANGIVQFINTNDISRTISVTFHGYEDGFIESNTEIHNGVIPFSYTTKDISSIVGAQPVMALLRIEGTSISSAINVRFLDENANNVSMIGAGGYQVRLNSTGDVTLALIATDSAGKFKFSDNNNSSVKIDIVAYWGGAQQWTGLRTIVFDDGAGGFETPPIVDTVLDLSSVVGAAKLTVLLELEADGSGNGLRYGFKPDDEVGDWLAANNSTHGIATGPGAPTSHSYYWVQTSDLGRVQWNSESTTSSDVRISILGYGVSPQAGVGSVVHTYLNLRVYFTNTMKDDTELRTPSNYQIIVDDPTTAYDFEAIEVIPEEGATYPSYVDLVVTDCTGGKGYVLSIVEDKLTSELDLLLGPNSTAFTGVTEAPDVLAVESISLTEMRVTFSKVMAVNEELKDPSNYSFTGGLKVLKVTVESSSSVILTTSVQTSAEIYDLTVS